MKKLIIKKILGKASEIKERSIIDNIKTFSLMALGIAVITGGITFAATADSRREAKELQAQMERDLQLERDRSAAYLREQEAKQKMFDNYDKAKDLVSREGEYVAFTITTERQPELSSEHKNWLSEALWKNVLRINITYQVKYLISLDKLEPIVTESGLYYDFDASDFTVCIVAPSEYVKMTPDKKETGWFPTEFSDTDALALLSSHANAISSEYANDHALLEKAMEQTKEFISSTASLFDTPVFFAEKRTGVKAKETVDMESIEEFYSKGKENN